MLQVVSIPDVKRVYTKDFKSMFCEIHFIYMNGIIKKELLLLVFLGLINVSRAFVLVNTPDSYLLVPRNSSINVTCTFTDDQGAGTDTVSVSWSRENDNQDIKEGIDTNWNETSQLGETRLHIPNVTNEEEEYLCLVYINGSTDYKRINIQGINNITHEKTLDNKVEVTPYMEEVNICDGPPLKLNCSFIFKDPCTGGVRVDWWEYNNDTKTWEKHVSGISWVSNNLNGTGWLNISNPGIETTFMCVVMCWDVGNIGLRVTVPVPPPHQGQKIKASHTQYPAVRNMSLILVCDIDKDSYSESGWWSNGRNIDNGKKHTLDTKKNSIELIIKEVGEEDEGQYTCWVSKDGWWDAASLTVYISEESAISVNLVTSFINSLLQIKKSW
ncbi:IgI 3 NCAM-1 [Finch poxvirus]|uniref:IgI 3 NCAM-1 n=2 Tax=unclassified Avipoxvirus TaxID=336487 RepID=A0AAT9UQM6_9POXV|nr:IgI 3 NCAM-1 [Finch poxvirus]UOX38960.1 IgI 3 NCAM-1 [Finch poxvirus]